MADDNSGSHASSSPLNHRLSPPVGNGHAPPGFGMRRAVTIDEGAQMRRRRRGTLDPNPHPNPNPNSDPSPTSNSTFADDGLLAGLRRGSSSFSDFSLGDARRDLGASAEDLLNPSGGGGRGSSLHGRQATSYLPLIFALLPAVAGIFFQNGASFFTDLILLSLAAVFLHWSVTQPWDWYHETQQVCVVDLVGDEVVSDIDAESDTGRPATALEDIEEDPRPDAAQSGGEKSNGEAHGNEPAQTHMGETRRAAREARRVTVAERAARELRVHEMVALAWCFLFPLLSSYLLHTIRSQLSRPSEGLVSDYNLTIFLCAAELRPVSHLISMVRARTLRFQRLAAVNPYADRAASASRDELRALSGRLDDLEARTAALLYPRGDEDGDREADAAAGSDNPLMLSPSSTSASRRNSKPNSQDQIAVAAAAQEVVAGTMQPELDALNRAMRRYEKKLALLATQTDARLGDLDRRVHDAVSIAAVRAAKQGGDDGVGNRQNPLLALATLPFRAVFAVLAAPFRAVAAALRLFQRSASSAAASSRRTRPRPPSGKPPRAVTAGRRGGSRDRDRDTDRGPVQSGELPRSRPRPLPV